MKSTAKAESLARDLKDRLEFRGFTVTESKNLNGWPKLTLGTDASILIEGEDAVSKDVFGNDLLSFAPHKAELSAIDGQSKQDFAKVWLELSKTGIDKTEVKNGANLAAAEGAPGEEITFDVRWPTKGI